MNNTVYPGATPQFRIIRNQENEDRLQLRYINITHGYISKWQDVPIVFEDEKEKLEKYG